MFKITNFFINFSYNMVNPIWNYYNKTDETVPAPATKGGKTTQPTKIAICKICSKKIKRTGSATSGPRTHLR